MAASVYTSGLPSYGPTSPTAQGSQGQFAQPNATSATQGQGQPGQNVQGSSVGAPPSSGSSSPVASNGTIPPGQVAGQPQPQQMSAQMPSTAVSQQAPGLLPATSQTPSGFGPPTSPDPFTAMGGGVWIGTGWVPRDHPLAALAQGQPPAQPGQPGTVQPGMSGTVPGTGQAGTYSDPTQLYTSAAPTYTPYQFSQFGQQVDPMAAQNQQAKDLLSQILSNPHSITDQGAGIMQERLKAQAVAQQQALMDALQQKQVASGFGTPGGYQQSQERRIGASTNDALLQGNQNLALERMKTDRGDELAALQAASGFMGNDAQRQSLLYNTLLGGQQAQAGDNFRGYGSEADAFNNHQQTALSAQQLALQKLLGQGGLDLDRSRLGESGRQFDLGNQLNWANLMNQMTMGRLGYGLDLANLQQGGQNALLSQIFGLGK